MKIAFVAAAALLAASAFAQGSVTSSSGASVSSGTGLAVTPGAPSTTVTVTPSTSVSASPSHRLTPGGAMVQRSSTTVLGGPSGTAAGTRTEVTTYWANVPANAPARHDFQRWQALK